MERKPAIVANYYKLVINTLQECNQWSNSMQKINSPLSYLFQIQYNDTLVKFTEYSDALKWCRDASKEGIKNVAIERVKADNSNVQAA